MALQLEAQDRKPRVIEVSYDRTASFAEYFAVQSFVFTPDGKQLIAAGNVHDPRLWIYDTATAKELRTTKTGGGSLRLAIARDSSLAVAGSTGAVSVWKPPYEKPVWEDGGIKRDDVGSVTFTPNGKKLLTTGWSESDAKSVNELLVWDAATGKLEAEVNDYQDFLRDAAVSPDGKTIAVAWDMPGTNGGLQLLDAANLKERWSAKAHFNVIHALDFAPNGRWLAAAGADGKISLWRTDRSEKLGQIPLDAEFEGKTLAISPDGKSIAAAGESGVVSVWNVATQERTHKLLGHSGEVECVAWSPKGKSLASSGRDKTIRIWSLDK